MKKDSSWKNIILYSRKSFFIWCETCSCRNKTLFSGVGSLFKYIQIVTTTQRERSHLSLVLNTNGKSVIVMFYNSNVLLLFVYTNNSSNFCIVAQNESKFIAGQCLLAGLVGYDPPLGHGDLLLGRQNLYYRSKIRSKNCVLSCFVVIFLTLRTTVLYVCSASFLWNSFEGIRSEIACLLKGQMRTRVELLPTFKFTGKMVKISEFTDNYR
jgi:hypothetical protein